MIKDDLALDVKLRLDIPDTFAIETPEDFDSLIALAVQESALEFMAPALGELKYNELAQLASKEAALDNDAYLYQAWVYFALFSFLHLQGEKFTQRNNAASVSFAQSGVSKSFTGQNGFARSSATYKVKAYQSMREAGYHRSFQFNRSGITTDWVRPGDYIND